MHLTARIEELKKQRADIAASLPPFGDPQYDPELFRGDVDQIVYEAYDILAGEVLPLLREVESGLAECIKVSHALRTKNRDDIRVSAADGGAMIVRLCEPLLSRLRGETGAAT